MNFHEDDRRALYDWIRGNFKSCKVVRVKKEIPIGDHYHLKKDEYFFLFEGKFLELTLGEGTAFDVPAPYIVNVPRGLYHKFICEPGSVLVGVATEDYDPNDELKL